MNKQTEALKTAFEITAAILVVGVGLTLLVNTKGPSPQEQANHKEDMIEPIVEPVVSTIYYSSQPNCPPCNAFKAIIGDLEDAGWIVTQKSIDGPTPQFEVAVAPQGKVYTKTGFGGKKSFYAWLRQISVNNDADEVVISDNDDFTAPATCPPNRTRYRLFRRR